MKKILLVLLIVPFFISCQDDSTQSGDVVKEPSKDGAIETVISVAHTDFNYDILTTTHKVWVSNQVVKTIVTTDTLKALGATTADSDEDEDGNTTKITVPKNYELYITVK